jgi:chaperonin cofactor prefoldin
MNLKPQLQNVMTELGVTEAELELLRGRMLSAVTSLEAHLNALQAQIATLSVQRDAIEEELTAARVTVSKLVST